MRDKDIHTTLRRSRRWFLLTGGAAGTVALAGCTGGADDDGADDEDPADLDTDDETDADDEDEDDDEEADEDEDEDDEEESDDEEETEEAQTYEIWAADQNRNVIYIYEGAADRGTFDLIDEIDIGQDGGDRPHMLHYSSDYEYAAVPTATQTFIYRAEDRELVGQVETGGGTHFAGFSPDDEFLLVDVIGANKIVKIDADLDAEEFTVADELVPSEEIDGIGETQNPVCHSYDANGRSIHTLGPGYGDAGLVIVDHGSFEIVASWPGEEVRTNCGTLPHPAREDVFYLTGGLPSNPDEGVEGVGELYVLDPVTDEIDDVIDTGGVDAHGLWFTSDGEELWVLNRETNDGLALDLETGEVIEAIEQFGPDEGDSPDIMWASPDGQFMFVTLRGPEPRTGSPHAATGVNPGVAVLSQQTRELVTTLEPDPIGEYSQEEIEDDTVATPDFHGIGVRPVGEFDTVATSPPF